MPLQYNRARTHSYSPFPFAVTTKQKEEEKANILTALVFLLRLIDPTVAQAHRASLIDIQ